jgi:hypothetical protein
VLGLLDLVQDAAGMLGQEQARLSWPHPAAGPLEQPGSRLRLELGELLADRGHREAQDRGRPGERALLDDGAVDREQARAQHGTTIQNL